MSKLLDGIEFPEDLKKLTIDDLPKIGIGNPRVYH